MGLRTRKFVGSIAIFLWLVVFSLAVMAIFGRFDRMHGLVELLVYAFLGFAWILPLKPIFVWMGRGSSGPPRGE